MANNTLIEYIPEFVTPPGNTLIEILESIGMTQADLSERTGRPKKTINEIVRGKALIMPDTALQFERVLGTPAAFWMNREQQYREWLARHNDRKAMSQHLEWLRQFPIRQMVQWKWIEKHPDPTDQLIELLRFFGVAAPEQWEAIWQGAQVSYRQSPAFTADTAAVSAWLRKGEIEGADILCEPYGQSAFDEVLSDARALTTRPPDSFVQMLTDLCAKAGVAIVFTPELPRTRVSGATRWLSPVKALIMLTLRYKTNDHLWFTFFHEAGHIRLHGKRDMFLDINGPTEQSRQEDEANRFAQDRLIPPEAFKAFKPSSSYFSHEEIVRFAAQIGIAPGIVVGRLQHDQIIAKNHFNDLRQHFEWVTEDTETD